MNVYFSFPCIHVKAMYSIPCQIDCKSIPEQYAINLEPNAVHSRQELSKNWPSFDQPAFDISNGPFNKRF